MAQGKKGRFARSRELQKHPGANFMIRGRRTSGSQKWGRFSGSTRAIWCGKRGVLLTLKNQTGCFDKSEMQEREKRL